MPLLKTGGWFHNTNTMFSVFQFFKRTTPIILMGLSLALMGCDNDGGMSSPGGSDNSDAFTVSIDPGTTYQTISGFGGANQMWGTQFLEPEEAKLAFSTDATGLGLSIFRVRIASNPAEWPLILESVQEAQKYGVKIQASPWSPPAALKSNGSDIGGYLLPENYGAFVDHINDFLALMEDNGIDIYAVSIQNEPDIQVSYESCDWTPGAMANFLAEYGDQIHCERIAAPESFNFDQSFTNTILDNPDASENVEIVAGHIYGGGLAAFPIAEQQGKEIWMTEYLLNLGTGNTGASPWTSYSDERIWEESLQMLSTMHDAMTFNWNAYIWWYIQRYYSFIGDGDQGTTEGTVLKRGIAYSHFSKYVRPGFVRIGTETSEASDLQITAYESDEQIVVVVVNPVSNGIGNVNFQVPSVSSAEVITTSESMNRTVRPSRIEDNRVIVGILGNSVSTVIIEK